MNEKQCTFLIPIRIDSEDRIRNVITSVSYLLEKIKSNVILKEVDSSPKFEKEILPYIKGYVSNTDSLNYIFEQSDDPVFYRMQIINEMLNIADTDVAANYDADVLLKPETIYSSIQKILNDEADVVYPYGGSEPWVYPPSRFQYAVEFYNNDMYKSFIENDYNFDVFHTHLFGTQQIPSYAGHVQFFNRKVYIDGGMENENFKGSSPDDFERLFRFSKLGYRVVRINDYVYHLEHYRGNNSYPISINGNPYYDDNVKLFDFLKTLDLKDLQNYYKSQEYLKKYM